MGSLNLILSGFTNALSPSNLWFCFIGTILGTLIGVLPGIGPAAGIAMLLTFTVSLPPVGAVIMLAAIYYGSMYGGSTTAILVNMPGEAACAVTALDGYPLARQGRAGAALAVAAVGSFVAGTLGLVGVTIFAPFLADMALAFGPPEYFGLVVLALSIMASLFGKSLLKGAISAFLGLLLTFPGLDPLLGVPRFTFGVSEFYGGIDYVSAVVGLFAIAEVLRNAEESLTVICEKMGRWLPSRNELWVCVGAMLRSSVLGFFLGLFPGCTPTVASFVSYDVEKRISKHPEKFGCGALEGVAAPETANNAATSAGFIPLFSLGIPCTAALAVLFGALMIFGLQPGPMLFQLHSDVVWTVIASMYIGNVMLLVWNLPLVGLWARLARIPYRFLAPAILVLCFIGAYSVRNRMFDVWMSIFFGLLGYLLSKADIPVYPLIMTLILGNMLESSIGQTLSMSRGSLAILLNRPIALGMLLFALAILIYSGYKSHRLSRAINLAEGDQK